MSDLLSHPLCSKAYSAFQSRFESTPSVLVHAPGRINLIGEHTDYNQGFVLPAAIPQGICLAMGQSSGQQHTWFALDTDEEYCIHNSTSTAAGQGWMDYFLGAYCLALTAQDNRPAIQCVFTSDLPAGAGLSSSSALTCAFLLGLNVLFDLQKTREDLAWMAHLVERNFIGLQGGIMDQHACLLSKANHFLLLDCLDRSYRHIEFPTDNGVHLFLIDTHIKHKLTDSDYNTRAAECRKAFEILHDAMGIQSLRDVTSVMLQNNGALLGLLLTQRIAFVLKENARVLLAEEKIRQHDWVSLGQLLYASHEGLRNDYEVSCAELDFLVEMVSSSSDIFGARMMGGGFGGCTINLASRPPDPSFQRDLIKRYLDRFGRECSFINVSLAEGASFQTFLQE